jgi:hypothetical protein
MAGIKNQMLRLRSDTVDKLKVVLDASAHRSMSALADEVLDKGLTRMLMEQDTGKAAETMRSLVNRNG